MTRKKKIDEAAKRVLQNLTEGRYNYTAKELESLYGADFPRSEMLQIVNVPGAERIHGHPIHRLVHRDHNQPVTVEDIKVALKYLAAEKGPLVVELHISDNDAKELVKLVKPPYTVTNFGNFWTAIQNPAAVKLYSDKQTKSAPPDFEWPINWTHTHYGRGTPPSAKQVLTNIRGAFSKCNGSAYGFQDEDFGFISVKMYENLKKRFPADEYLLDYVGEEIAKNAAEAVRVWWNEYGFSGSVHIPDYVSNIYNDGLGPDGIGGFREPEE